MTITLINKSIPAVSGSTVKRLLDELRVEGKLHCRESAECGRETMIHAIPPQSVAPLGLTNACLSGVCGPFDCVEESGQSTQSDPSPTHSAPVIGWGDRVEEDRP
ncbi:MAG: hypothetical protein BroJett004_27460 [Planctomycetota bacterium]|nr:MAG: hypothetical protein BroJett004_27460 [Planctomycetota bacterium]